MFCAPSNSYANHGFIYLDDGSLYGFGSNSFSRLGLGPESDDNVNEYIGHHPGIRKICCSRKFSMLLFEDGTVKVAGLMFKNDQFKTLVSDPNIVDIGCNNKYAYLLCRNGSVYMSVGPQCEIQTLYKEKKGEYFYRIFNLPIIQKIFVLKRCVFAYDHNNRLWVWGSNARLKISLFETEQDEIKSQVKSRIDCPNPVRIEKLERFIDKFIFPHCLGIIPNLHDIFFVKNIYFLWSDSNISIIGGYLNYSITNPHIIFSSKDIVFVNANTTVLMIKLSSGQTLTINPTFNNFNFDIDVNNVLHIFMGLIGTKQVGRQALENFTRLFIPMPFQFNGRIYLGSDYSLGLYEDIFDKETIQTVELIATIDKPQTIIEINPENFKHNAQVYEEVKRDKDTLTSMMTVAIPMLSNAEDNNSKNVKNLNPLFPLIYDEGKTIKILGAGSLEYGRFETKYYKYYPCSTQKFIVFVLFVLKEIKITKFLRYEILKFII